MTANLLCHCPKLFCCGIARSGAYNRTLTPFGFQSEERELWDIPHIYTSMSPFMNAQKIESPLLLIHGQEDSNSGTFPEQSERFFRALQGLGKKSKLVLLPKESHNYRARESILHSLAETHEWLSKHSITKQTIHQQQTKPSKVILSLYVLGSFALLSLFFVRTKFSKHS
eukprot:c10206_g1_i1.p1 GENE.c10206_g1_i1~~c10206_g1_i1.p1  ORF type:complete len:170 (-),score=53.98 c10206_g1_i1:41-550(-)